MNELSVWSIFIDACLINNFVLVYFLGICPFLGVSEKRSMAVRMGAAVTFVMLVSSICAYGIQALLVAIGAHLPEADFVHCRDCFDRSTGRDVRSEVQSDTFSNAGHFSATDHDQLRDSWIGPVPDQSRIRIGPVGIFCAGRWRRVHIGAGADGWFARETGTGSDAGSGQGHGDDVGAGRYPVDVLHGICRIVELIMLENLITGVAGMTALVCGWLTVQLAWQKAHMDEPKNGISANEAGACFGCRQPICPSEKARNSMSQPPEFDGEL